MATKALVSPRQQEILDRTLEIVRRSGIGGLTMRGIAAEVGVSDAALYRHFPSKQALLLALLDRIETMLLGPAAELAADAALPAEERLRRILENQVRVVLETESAPLLVLMEASAGGESALVERIGRIVQRHGEILSSLIAEIDPGRNAPRPRDLALLCLGIPAAVAIRNRICPEPGKLRAVSDRLVPFLVNCLQADDGGKSG